MIRPATIEQLSKFRLEEDNGEEIKWCPGQVEIADCILHKSSPDGKNRIQIVAATRYGKSLAAGAALAIRASSFAEKWAIVAGTKEKARIIMDYVIMFSLNNPAIRSQLLPGTSLDRLKMRKSQDRMVYRGRGEIRVYSAEATRVRETSKALMGFGSPNIVEDESALIPDQLQATVMRMLGDKKENLLIKIGNPFNRNHFLRTWKNDRYYKIFIDYKRALEEGRFSEEFIKEMREEAMFDILYECLFPKAGQMDARGWIPLLTDLEIARAMVEQDYHFGDRRLGCDVAGDGRNFSVIVHRSFNLARKIYKEDEPDTMKFASAILNKVNILNIKDGNVFIDKNGIGKGCYDKIKISFNKTEGVSGGEEPDDKKRFFNKRAEMHWRAREWILSGGKLIKDNDWYQLVDIKYKIQDRAGKIQIMSKKEMLSEGIPSPDVADSLILTFYNKRDKPEETTQAIETEVKLDPY